MSLYTFIWKAFHSQSIYANTDIPIWRVHEASLLFGFLQRRRLPAVAALRSRPSEAGAVHLAALEAARGPAGERTDGKFQICDLHCRHHLAADRSGTRLHDSPFLGTSQIDQGTRAPLSRETKTGKSGIWRQVLSSTWSLLLSRNQNGVLTFYFW